MVEHGSVEGAVTAFCRDASPAEVRKLSAEWRMLMVVAADWSIEATASLLAQDLGGSWVPRSKRDLARVSQALESANSGPS